MFVYYYMMLFSGFVTDTETRFYVYGYTFLYLLVSIMAVNLVHGITASIQEYRAKKRLQQIKDAKIKKRDKMKKLAEKEEKK